MAWCFGLRKSPTVMAVGPKVEGYTPGAVSARSGPVQERERLRVAPIVPTMHAKSSRSFLSRIQAPSQNLRKSEAGKESLRFLELIDPLRIFIY